MLDLVEASILLHVIWLCWNTSEHFPPRSTVLRHHKGPQGRMLEQQRVGAVRQRSISTGISRDVSLSLFMETTTALLRQMYPGDDEEIPFLCSAHCFGRKHCMMPGKEVPRWKFRHAHWDWWERCNAESKGKKDQAHQEQKSFPDGYLSPIPKNHGGISIDFPPLCKLSLNCTLKQYEFSYLVKI